MAATTGLFLLGCLLLAGGAEILVRGASGLARAAGISPLAVGLTVVAFASSFPELAVTLLAALRGETDVALGNVVGSNIFNVLGVLGLAAVAMPLFVSRRVARVDVPLMALVSAFVLLLAWDRRIAPWEGGLLAAGAAAYAFLQIRRGRREASAAPSAPAGSAQGGTARHLGAVGLGALLIAGGARFMVQASVDAASVLGISDLVIGLTVLAVGSSLPEAATSVAASLRGQRDLAVGNVVGSNILNILAVLGMGALVSPGGLPVPPGAFTFDMPVLLGVALAALPVFYTGYAVGRWEGLLFLGYYAAYVLFLFLRSTRHEALPAFNAAMLYFVLPLTAMTLGISAWKYARRRRGVRFRS